MRLLSVLILLFAQAASSDPLPQVRATLRQLGDQFETHRATLGAAPALTTAKHELRDWVEGQLAVAGRDVDPVRFAQTLHAALRDADLFCNGCDENVLGYVDPVRVSRLGEFVLVVTSFGIGCSYDDSAYVYAFQDGAWTRVWEHERTTYTPQEYLPQQIHDVQLSDADANGRRTLLLLGSQPLCRGSFLSVYARAWRVSPDGRFAPVLDRRELAYDNYPPILGLARPGEVLFQYTADGFLAGGTHVAYRRFTVDGTSATQVDPIAVLPRDFVLEWLDAPWQESRTRSESPALEAQHAALRRPDKVGDEAEPTRRCTGEADVWQVGTNLFEGPKRYYRVRWRQPFTFSMIAISETPFADCTIVDSRATVYTSLGAIPMS